MSCVAETIPVAHAELFQALVDPFAKEEVKVREGRGGTKLQYISARTAMNRLDRVLGPLNWRDSYRPWGDHALICRLELRVDGEWIAKEAIGGRADMTTADDDDKSAESDAFKRACVKWGIGRYLYRDGVPEFAAESSAPTQNVLGEMCGSPPIHAPGTPHNGRAFWAWLKEQGERAKVDLLRYIESWGQLQKFPPQLVNWTGEQVSLGMTEAIRKLTTTPPPQQFEPLETQLFEPLPNPPRTGKALFKAIDRLQDEHQIALLKEVNDWAARQHRRKDRMVDWPDDFIEEAWLYVSSLVAQRTGQRPSVQAEPSANGPAYHPDHNGNPPELKALRDEFAGWCEGVVRHVFQTGDAAIAKDQLREEANRIVAMRFPGRSIKTLADLVDPDDLRKLIVAAQQRFEEVRQPGNF